MSVFMSTKISLMNEKIFLSFKKKVMQGFSGGIRLLGGEGDVQTPSHDIWPQYKNLKKNNIPLKRDLLLHPRSLNAL